MASKLVIVVRADLGMTTGKIAAQVAHAAVAAALATRGTPEFRDWVDDGQPKVVLRVADLDGLESVERSARAAGLHVEVIRDAGRTQVDADTPTCCAVGPGADDVIDQITGGLSLF